MIKEYTSLGLMSGTSGDGVDASIINNATIAANNNTRPLAASNLKNHLKGLER